MMRDLIRLGELGPPFVPVPLNMNVKYISWCCTGINYNTTGSADVQGDRMPVANSAGVLTVANIMSCGLCVGE